MNHIIRTDFDQDEWTPRMAYFTIHTDGEPEGLYWVWEISKRALCYYFRDQPDVIDTIDNEDMYEEDVERFINDESILEESDAYEGGKSPRDGYGCWYAPLTMDQIEQSFGI